MPRAGIFPARRWLLDEYATPGGRRERNRAGTGAIRMEAARSKLAGRRAEHANQSAGRTISFRREAGDTHAGTGRLRFGIRCNCGAQAGEYSSRRTADVAADG